MHLISTLITHLGRITGTVLTLDNRYRILESSQATPHIECLVVAQI